MMQYSICIVHSSVYSISINISKIRLASKFSFIYFFVFNLSVMKLYELVFIPFIFNEYRIPI